MKAHFGLNDDECTACLVAVCGPNPAGEKFWTDFKEKIATEAKEKAVQKPAANGEADKEEEDVDGEEWEGPPIPEADGMEEDGEEEEDDLDDGDEGEASLCGSSSSRPDAPAPPGGVAASPVDEGDTMEYMQEAYACEHSEPVIAPVASKPDDGQVARKQLEDQLKSTPSPAKAGLYTFFEQTNSQLFFFALKPAKDNILTSRPSLARSCSRCCTWLGFISTYVFYFPNCPLEFPRYK